MKIRNKIISLINIGLISMSVSAAQNNCEWRSDGCVKINKDEIDLRSNASKMLDDVFACKNTAKGCTEKEQEAINRVSGKKATLDITDTFGRSITGHDLLDLVSKNEDQGFNKKKYYVPLNLTKQELLTFAAATSLGLVVFHNDQEIMDYVQETKTEKTEEITDVANLFGRELIPPIAVGSYFLGVVFDNGKLKNVGLITVTAGLATQLITEAFKKSTSRVRPNEHEGPYEFGKKGNNSFFSGHTSGAFSLATVLSETFKDEHKWVPYVAYGAAALTAYSRMHDEKHWGSDVLVGALVGHYVTKMVYRMHTKDGKGNMGLTIYPAFNPISGDFSIEVSFTGKEKDTKFKCEQIPQGPQRVSACIKEVFDRAN